MYLQDMNKIKLPKNSWQYLAIAITKTIMFVGTHKSYYNYD